MSKTQFEMKVWDENPYYENGHQKLSKVTVTKSYSGEIKGEGSLEYLMAYSSSESALFVGIELIIGEIDGKSGTFFVQHSGVFNKGEVVSQFNVVAGSATGELKGLRGTGRFSVGHGMVVPVEFEYSFEL